MVLVGISAELRLQTYMNNRGQVETMSALSSTFTNENVNNALNKVFYSSNVKQLMRYYYTARPLKCFISQLDDRRPPEEPPVLYDNSLLHKAYAYESLCCYQESRTCTEQALKNDRCKCGESASNPDIALLLNLLGCIWNKLGHHRKALSYHEESLQMRLCIYGETTAHSDMGVPWQ